MSETPEANQTAGTGTPTRGDDGRIRKPSGAIDRAAEAGLPPDQGPEVIVMTLRPAMFRASPFVVFGLWLALIGGAVGGLVGHLRGMPLWAVIALLVLAVLAVVGLFVLWLRTRHVALRVTNKRTIEVRGLFSRATSEVLHDNIRNLQVHQTFWQRLLRVGSLGLSSSGQDGIEIEVKNLPNPVRAREVIDLYRDME